MDLIYSVIPGTKISDKLITLCSKLFSSQSEERMNAKKIKENFLFDLKSCGVVIAGSNDIISGCVLVGYAFYHKYMDPEYGKVCWITQLVVDNNSKESEEIATNLINMLFDPDSNVCGMVTKHLYEIELLEKGTGYKVDPSLIIYNLDVPHIFNSFRDENYLIDFNVADSTDVYKTVQGLKENGSFTEKLLPNGYEYIVLIRKH